MPAALVAEVLEPRAATAGIELDHVIGVQREEFWHSRKLAIDRTSVRERLSKPLRHDAVSVVGVGQIQARHDKRELGVDPVMSQRDATAPTAGHPGGLLEHVAVVVGAAQLEPEIHRPQRLRHGYEGASPKTGRRGSP